MKLTLLALVCVLSVAHAARQVVLAPPPPPAKSGDSPGILFSYDIPGYTSSSFGAVQQAQLCSLVQSTAEGRTGCVISSFIPRNTSVAVGGYMTWEFDTVPSSAQLAAAAAQRDAALTKLKANTTLVSGTFAGAVQNCECTDAFNGDSTNPLVASGLISALPGLPLAGCNQLTPTNTVKGVAGTTNVTSTVDTVGIDSGKYCSGGIVVPATGGVSVEVTNAGSGYITAPTVTFDPAPSGGVTATGVAVLFGSQVQGVATTAGYTTGAGCATATGATGCAIVSAADQSGSGATCAVSTGRSNLGVDANDIIITSAGSGYVGIPSIVITGCATPPTGYNAVLSGSGVKSITLTNAGAGYITSPTVTITGGGGSGATAKASAGWSPKCDSDPVFYQANFGTRCPQCTNGAGSKILFDFNGPNTGRFCGGSISGTSGVQTPLAGAVSGTPRAPIDAAQRGSSCIKVGVYKLAGSDQGKPCVGNFDVNNQIDGETIADTISSSITQYFASDVTSAIGGTTCASVYRNTEFNVPCSTPKLKGPPAAVGATEGVNGKGACDTFSTFYSQGPTSTVGGTPTLSTGTGQYQCLLTAQTFVQAFTPAPAPSVPTPAPTPSAPVPAPNPTPVPSPPAPIVCVYKGTYRITPLYAPCSTYYLASGTDDNCSNNLVNLRTRNNLGQKFNRASWTFATESKGNLGKPTNVLANARTGCTNKYLAAPSDPTTLKVGGSAWKWQFVPYPGNDKCDEVNMISQNRITTTAFLQVPKTCDRFRYNATDGGRQRFRLRPVA